MCLIGLITAVFVCVVVSFCVFVWHLFSLNPARSHSAKSLLGQYFFQLLVLYLGSSAYKRLIRASRRLVSTQETVLREILSKNRNTRFGLDHGFHEIRSREDFVRTVPLTTYSTYEPYIDDVVGSRTAKSVLTEDAVVFLATSSGTTGRNKTIPLTAFTKRTAARDVGPMMVYRQTAIEGGLTLRRLFVLSYRAETRRSESQVEVGPVSAHIGRYPPYAVAPPEVYEIADERAALHAHALFALAEREVGRMESLMSTLVHSFWRHVEDNWSSICDGIETGVVRFPPSREPPAFEERLAAVVGKHFRPDPDRARQLRAEFERGFVGIAKRVWPCIQSVRMVTSGSFAHHARLLRTVHMRGVKQVSPIHAASEGFFGVNMSTEPDDDDDDSSEPRYTLLPEFGFFEFIEESRIDEEQPLAVFAEQVRLNVSYELVYTSQTGLYRYRTGDVVKISSFSNQCPTYTFAYRVGQMLNLYWEKTPEAVFYSSVCHALDSIGGGGGGGGGVVLVDYTATEDIFVPFLKTDASTSSKHYVLFIEVEFNGKEVRLEEDALSQFDESLSQKFELYSTLRRSQSIGPMKVYQLRRGAFGRASTCLPADGGRNSRLTSSGPQYKVPRVSRDIAFLKLLAKEILT